jgi:hypothetical protein
MEFLHSEFDGGPNDTVLVTLDAQANVMLLDESNFVAYRNGRTFSYFGGWATSSPIQLVPPRVGRWHVVVDLGGCTGTVRASIRVARLPHGRQATLF